MNNIIINEKTAVLLFRFKSAPESDYITEHRKVMNQYGHVWMLKAGKVTSEDKIHSVMKNGGWLLLKSKKEDGGKYYLAKFDSYCRGISDKTKHIVPSYKNMYSLRANDKIQAFRVVWISEELSYDVIQHFRLNLDGRSVPDFIDNTSTAVMFVYNDKEIQIRKSKTGE